MLGLTLSFLIIFEAFIFQEAVEGGRHGWNAASDAAGGSPPGELPGGHLLLFLKS